MQSEGNKRTYCTVCALQSDVKTTIHPSVQTCTDQSLCTWWTSLKALLELGKYLPTLKQQPFKAYKNKKNHNRHVLVRTAIVIHVTMLQRRDTAWLLNYCTSCLCADVVKLKWKWHLFHFSKKWVTVQLKRNLRQERNFTFSSWFSDPSPNMDAWNWISPGSHWTKHLFFFYLPTVSRSGFTEHTGTECRSPVT